MKKISYQNREYEFSLEKVLGKGSFASVYQGRSLQDNSDVAVKVILKNGLEKYGQTIIDAIGEEVNILQKISEMSLKDPCPYIVGILDCFSTNSSIYIVLEYCNQKTLQHVINANPSGIPESQAAAIFFQIAFAIKHLSKNNIVHRDIKPENVFIHNGVFKLGDFGFASQKNLYSTSLGTYPYMAPEFFKDNNQYSKEVDVWAAGVMYHQMLFNELYFFGANQMQLQKEVLNKVYKVEVSSKVSANSVEVLRECLQKDPKLRISAEKLILKPLFSAYLKDPAVQQLLNACKENAQKALMSKSVNFPESRKAITKQLEQGFGAMTMLSRLSIKLSQKYSEKFRFEIFCILRKCLNGMTAIQSTLQSRMAPGFITITDPIFWQDYIQSQEFSNANNSLQSEKLLVTTQFYEMGRALKYFISMNYPKEQQQGMIQTFNDDIFQIIDPQLYYRQTQNLYQFFFNEYQRNGKTEDLVFTAMLAVAGFIDICLMKKLVDFNNIETIAQNLSKDGLNKFVSSIFTAQG